MTQSGRRLARPLLWTLTLLSWEFRAHDGREHAVHMIFVAQKAVLARRAVVVTRLAEMLLHLTEIGYEILRTALFIALQIGGAILKFMAGQTPAIFQDADALTYTHRLEMRLMNEIREGSLFALDQKRGKIDDTPFALDIVYAVAFRA